MRKLLTVIMLIGLNYLGYSQVGINNEDPKATLDIVAKTQNGNTFGGLLIPRLSPQEIKNMTESNTVGAQQNSLLVYINNGFNNEDERINQYKYIDSEGYYYFDYDNNTPENSVWKKVVNKGDLKNIYTDDGEISKVRTITLNDDTSNILITKKGNKNDNPLLVVNGTVKASAFDTRSDERLKDDIKNLSTDGLYKLRPVSYIWNKKGIELGGNDKVQFGFIAQEVEKVFPQLVTTSKVGKDGIKSINYIGIIPILTQSIIEQKEANIKQQQQIDQLKSEIKKLKDLIKNK